MGHAGRVPRHFGNVEQPQNELPAYVPIYALWYNSHMKQKPLIETNPYLREPEKFRKALITNVSTSTAVETGAPPESIARTLLESDKTLPLTKPEGSAR